MWKVVFSRRSIWVLLELIRRWTQHFSKIDQETCKLNKFAFGTPWLPDLLCKHRFTSSVWNFCRWVAEVPLREKSLSVDEQGETSAFRRLQKLLSQLILFLLCSSWNTRRASLNVVFSVFFPRLGELWHNIGRKNLQISANKWAGGV